MARGKKKEGERDATPYVESFERLTGVETHRKFVDSDTGAARSIFSDVGALAICARLIEGRALESDYPAFRDLDAGMGEGYYGDDVCDAICEASAALILSDDSARDWLARVAREGLDAVRAADSARTQEAQGDANAAATEDEIFAARFRQGLEIVKACGENAKRRAVITALFHGGYTCAEIYKIRPDFDRPTIYKVRNEVAADFLRKQLPLPDNLKLRKIGMYTPITADMGKAARKAAMNKNLLLASGDAGQAARAVPDPNRKKKKAWGEGEGLSLGRHDDEGGDE